MYHSEGITFIGHVQQHHSQPFSISLLFDGLELECQGVICSTDDCIFQMEFYVDSFHLPDVFSLHGAGGEKGSPFMAVTDTNTNTVAVECYQPVSQLLLALHWFIRTGKSIWIKALISTCIPMLFIYRITCSSINTTFLNTKQQMYRAQWKSMYSIFPKAMQCCYLRTPRGLCMVREMYSLRRFIVTLHCRDLFALTSDGWNFKEWPFGITNSTSWIWLFQVAANENKVCVATWLMNVSWSVRWGIMRESFPRLCGWDVWVAPVW